jgi:hypothetical protein
MLKQYLYNNRKHNEFALVISRAYNMNFRPLLRAYVLIVGQYKAVYIATVTQTTDKNI